MPQMKFARTFLRENPATELYPDSSALLSYINDTFIQTGKCIVWRNHIQQDPNTILVESVWASNEALMEALEDPMINSNYQAMIQYNQNNAVSITNEVISAI